MTILLGFWVMAMRSTFGMIGDMVAANSEWNWPLFQHLLPHDVLLNIAAVKCHASHFTGDSICWKRTNSGRFYVSSAYRIRNGIMEGPKKDVWKVIDRYKGAFAKEKTNWDLTFGGLCWFIWLNRNSRIFYNHDGDEQDDVHWSVMAQVKAWFQHAALSSNAYRVSQQAISAQSGVLCHWLAPPPS
ncbi:hypothetical protein V6N12_062296 [Hibiscus sabdariffa]|uniref:Uncharacterized protein n=1 Tax=Hibiscus sabdariffa TaxID=183260 RepID=A0ABR2F8E9_9ROSI